MAKFALLLNHAPDRYEGLSEDEYFSIIKDYVAWIEKASDDGFYVAGHKLSGAPGRVLKAGTSGIEVHESPFTELPEVLGGIMVIEAPDMSSAMERVQDHPHFTHNSALEIRQIDDVGDDD